MSRFQLVTGMPFRATCCKCGKHMAAGKYTEGHLATYADLDGEPFKAYYCASCAFLNGATDTTHNHEEKSNG